MQKKSLFIVIEGLDGSGKTSAGRLLTSVLNQQFPQQVRLTFEPHDASCGGLYIRQVLTKKIKNFSPKTLALLFAANRLDHCDREINPWLSTDNQSIIICDRYYLSSLVYQSSPEIPMSEVFELNNQARKPDIIFFLNVSNEVCYQRMKIRNQPQELFESNLAQTREKYQQAIHFLRERNQDNIIEIDGSGTIEEVVNLMLQAIGKHLTDWEIPTQLSDNSLINNDLYEKDFNYTLQDFIQSLPSNINLENIDNQLVRLSESALHSLFLDYLTTQQLEVGKKLPLAFLNGFELSYTMPLSLPLRGVALLMASQIKYEEILKNVSELTEMFDFILIFSAQMSKSSPFYYERDKIQVETSSQGLFPATRILTLTELAQGIFEYLERAKYVKSEI